MFSKSIENTFDVFSLLSKGLFRFVFEVILKLSYMLQIKGNFKVFEGFLM